MTQEQFEALIEYIDAKCNEATHAAIHRSVSTQMSKWALERLQLSGIVEEESS